MSFRGDRIDDETSFLWSPEYIFVSPELYLPLRQPQNHQYQTLHRRQQQVGISHESWLRENLLNVRSRVRLCFFRQPILSSVQDPSLFTMSRIEMGQRIGQGNGIAHPTLSYSHEFPNHLQEIQQVSSDAFGSLFRQHFHRFSDDNLPVITTNITQRHCLCAHPLSTRSHNYMPYQTYAPITSAFTINGQQLPPSVLAIRCNEAHNLRGVNNSARHHVIMQRRVHQSSSSFRITSLYTQLRRLPSANSSIPPQNEVLGSRRRTYESRFQFGQPSSSTRRRRTIPADGSVGSTAVNPTEERREYGLYDPEYERQGLCIDPHLRNFLNQ